MHLTKTVIADQGRKQSQQQEAVIAFNISKQSDRCSHVSSSLTKYRSIAAMSENAPAGGSMQKEEERPDEDAESVFSDSEEEEGEMLGGKRDVASDAEDEGGAVVDDLETAAGKKKPSSRF